MTLQEAFHQLDEVRDEYRGAGFALRHALRGYQSDPAVNEAGSRDKVTLHHLQSCEENLQVTYFVRLFAEFEAILRDYWLKGRRRMTAPPMAVLMHSVAAYCFISLDDTQSAHEVRGYRNDVIHERLQDPQFDFQTCHSRLACFVRWLPRKW